MTLNTLSGLSLRRSWEGPMHIHQGSKAKCTEDIPLVPCLETLWNGSLIYFPLESPEWDNKTTCEAPDHD